MIMKHDTKTNWKQTNLKLGKITSFCFVVSICLHSIEYDEFFTFFEVF